LCFIFCFSFLLNIFSCYLRSNSLSLLLSDQHKILSDDYTACCDFVSKYTLTESQVFLLEGPFVDDFFVTFQLVKLIKKNSLEFLFEGENNSLGKQIVKQMNSYLDFCTERLHSFVLKELSFNCGESSNIVLKKALFCLYENQSLYKHYLEEIQTIRIQIIVNSFVNALTVGNTRQRPIDEVLFFFFRFQVLFVYLCGALFVCFSFFVLSLRLILVVIFQRF